MNEDKCPSMCPTSYDLYCQAIALKELVLIEKLEAHVDLMMNHVEECKECNEHTCNGPSRSEHIDKCQKCFDAMANIVNEKKESLKKKLNIEATKSACPEKLCESYTEMIADHLGRRHYLEKIIQTLNSHINVCKECAIIYSNHSPNCTECNQKNVVSIMQNKELRDKYINKYI